MAVIKIGNRTEKPFAQIDNKLLNDSRLSWRAKGLLCYLISKPADWTIVADHLVSQGKEGRDAVRAAFQELKELGYASLEVFRDDETGKVTGSAWTVHEMPENRKPEIPATGKPHAGKSATTNTEDSTNTEKTTKKASPKAVHFKKPLKTEVARYVEENQRRESSTEMEEVVSAWNETDLPKCLKLTSVRIGHLKARLKSEFWRNNWRRALALIVKSPFCNGKNDRGWKADFDFFTRSEDAVARAMEGKYDGNAIASRTVSDTDTVWKSDIWNLCRELKEGNPFDLEYTKNKFKKALRYVKPITISDFLNEQLPGEKETCEHLHKLLLSLVPGEGTK